MIRAVVFDLGGTLISTFTREEFGNILQDAIVLCTGVLAQRGLERSIEEVMQRALLENHESPDYRVRPLEQRLCSIFGLVRQDCDSRDGSRIDEAVLLELCGAFMKPILRVLRCYDDSKECLGALKKRGLKTAVLTNTPWGSPSHVWREEIKKLGLAPFLDDIVCCRDVGWRKPSRRPFDRVVQALDISPAEAVMVGDSLTWDVEGALAAGMRAVHIDRSDAPEDGAGYTQAGDVYRIRSLRGLVRCIDELDGEVKLG